MRRARSASGGRRACLRPRLELRSASARSAAPGPESPRSASPCSSPTARIRGGALHRGARGSAYEAVCIDAQEHPGRDAHEKAAHRRPRGAQRVELMCHAGWMRILSPAYIRAFAGRRSTSTPRCCPRFPGSTRSGRRSSTARRWRARPCTSPTRAWTRARSSPRPRPRARGRYGGVARRAHPRGGAPPLSGGRPAVR